MTLWYFFSTELCDFIYWFFCYFCCWFTFAYFSPVNGLIVVGVVVVFSPVCPSCVTFSSPGFKSGLNSRFLEWYFFFSNLWFACFWTMFCDIVYWWCYYFTCFRILDAWFTWYFFCTVNW